MTVNPNYLNVESSPPTDLGELDDFTKLNWKSKSNKIYWEEDLFEFADMANDIRVEAVARDDHPREIAFQTYDSGDSVGIGNDLASRGLDVETRNTGEDRVTVIVGSSESVTTEAVEILNQFHTRNRMDILELMGVPDEAIEKNREWKEERITSPVYEMACNSPSAERESDNPETIYVPDADGMLNVMWSYLGFAFIDFYPPSFEHEPSREIAIKNGQIYRDMEFGDQATKASNFLSAPMSWSGYHRLGHVKNPFALGEYDLYDDRWAEKKVLFKGIHEELIEQDVDAVTTEYAKLGE